MRGYGLWKINSDLDKRNILCSSPNKYKKNKNRSIDQIKKYKVNNYRRGSNFKLSRKLIDCLYSLPDKDSSSKKINKRSCVSSEKKLSIKSKKRKSDKCKSVKTNVRRFSNYDIGYTEKMKKKYNNMINLRKNKNNLNKVLSFRKIICNKNNSNDLKYVNYYQLLKKNH